eukprot:05921.XXX_152145_152285_1 [CDS] Oithona nana genome sequencing.
MRKVFIRQKNRSIGSILKTKSLTKSLFVFPRIHTISIGTYEVHKTS